MTIRSIRLGTAAIVATREGRHHARSPLVWLLVLTAVTLAVFAVHVGIDRLRLVALRHAELSAQLQSVRGDGSVPLFGLQAEPALRVLRPPEPLSILARGLDTVTPSFWDFSPSGVRRGAPFSDVGRARAAASNVDLEFLIRVVVGLLAILLAVDSVAGERERGELLALLGQSVEPRDVLLGKLLGGAAILGAAVGAVCAAALVTTLIEDRTLITRGYVLSLLSLWAAGWLYCFVCFSGALLLSTVSTSYRLGLTAAFVTWTVMTLVVVDANAVLVPALAPARSPAALEIDRERLVESASATIRDSLGDQFAAALGGPSAWVARQDDATLVRSVRARLDPLWDRHVAEVRGQLDAIDRAAGQADQRQELLSRIASFLNPAAEFVAAAGNLAGTGEPAAAAWQDTTAAYQRELNGLLFDNQPRYYIRVPYTEGASGTSRHLLVALDRHALTKLGGLPAFAAPGGTFRHRLKDAQSHLLVLLAYAAAFVGGTLVAFQRLRF